MSDLISRSRVIENIWDVFNSYANDSLRFDEYETEAINRAFTVLQKTIEGQQTVYNLDKVLIELDEQTNLHNISEASDYWTWITAMEKAIDIVKRGGIDE